MPRKLKLMSLFDGSGGFPLAGSMCGFVPTYASEVEPYPIAVTTSRFPNMQHLGDVKAYSKEQLLKWYNSLHTDSAEYKMWGNGIALPCALYVMQGIQDVMRGAV